MRGTGDNWVTLLRFASRTVWTWPEMYKAGVDLGNTSRDDASSSLLFSPSVGMTWSPETPFPGAHTHVRHIFMF